MIPVPFLIAHFVGDFLFQTDWMALNKSKRFDALTIHVAIYSLCFLPWGLKFFFLTLLTHWITDFYTSRLTSRLWFFDMKPLSVMPYCKVCADYDFAVRMNGKRHWFFVAIGADQLVHYLTLWATYQLLF